MDSLPDNIDELKAALVAEAARAAHAEAELAVARANASDDQALIAHQQLQIEKLRRTRPTGSTNSCRGTGRAPVEWLSPRSDRRNEFPAALTACLRWDQR